MNPHKLTHGECFNTLKQHYSNKLANQKSWQFFAPGRVNLIGEYTDFNGGLVLPCAIHQGTYLIVQTSEQESFRFYSMQEPEVIHISKQELLQANSKQTAWSWANYPIGVLKHFQAALLKRRGGLDFFFYGNLPVAAGLSSSASIEVVTAFALKTLLDSGHSLTDIARLAQKAENDFIGVQCGIMDQYTVAHGLDQHALLIDCQQQRHKAIAMPMLQTGYQWLIINSNKPRQLSESKYNERRQECEQALSILQETCSLEELCDYPFDEIERLYEKLNDASLFHRAHHVISEQQRVVEFSEALANSDVHSLGKLMNASHQSLSKDFEVSGDTLDTLVSISQLTDGVLGARMTGAGFGGCTINLIEKNKAENIIKHITEQYQAATGLSPACYLAQASSGVHQYQGEHENN